MSNKAFDPAGMDILSYPVILSDETKREYMYSNSAHRYSVSRFSCSLPESIYTNSIRRRDSWRNSGADATERRLFYEGIG